ncbi:hypothetical protein ACWBC2_08280 [Salegentibacter agarivorans]
MKKYLLLFIAAISLTFVGCNYEDDFNAPNYVTFEDSSSSVGVDLGSSATFDVTVYAGNTVGSDRTIGVMVAEASTLDAAAYTVPGTVTIPANSNEGTLSIEASDLNLGPNGETLILELQPEAGLSVGDPMTITVNQICPYPETKLEIVFDDWASETAWEVMDAEGVVVFSGSGYADGTPMLNRNLCLDTGDYTFSITDAYGDGLTAPEVGSVTLTYNDAELVSFDGDFGEGTSVDFTIE